MYRFLCSVIFSTIFTPFSWSPSSPIHALLSSIGFVSDNKSSTWSRRRPLIAGYHQPVGRTAWSTISPSDFSSSLEFTGVAGTKIVCGAIVQTHRTSRAVIQRRRRGWSQIQLKSPYERSPLYIAPICSAVTYDSSMISGYHQAVVE